MSRIVALRTSTYVLTVKWLPCTLTTVLLSSESRRWRVRHPVSQVVSSALMFGLLRYKMKHLPAANLDCLLSSSVFTGSSLSFKPRPSLRPSFLPSFLPLPPPPDLPSPASAPIAEAINQMYYLFFISFLLSGVVRSAISS